MAEACKQSETGKKILVSEQCYLQAQNKISFQYYTHKLFKGKSIELPIYIPLEKTDEELVQLSHRVNIFPSLRTHLYSYPYYYDQKHKDEVEIERKTILRQFEYRAETENLLDIRQRLNNLIGEFLNTRTFNAFTLLKGPFGSGKSLFLRQFLASQLQLYRTQTYKYQEKLQILVASVNVATKDLKLNGFRPILQQLLQLFCSRREINYLALAPEQRQAFVDELVPRT